MAADINTELGKVRYYIGDYEEPYNLPDEVIQSFLDLYVDESSDYRIWKTVIDCLTIMKGRAARESSRRREREGGVEIEVYSNLTYESISELLEWWKDNPPVVPKGYDLHIFGGVSKEEICRVRENPDSNLPPIRVGGTYAPEDEFVPTKFTSQR